ncbi:MAG: MFS transporter [Pseudomonadota bacterium]|nr:MFS transporter [Pseudomonadota bacterium]
MIIAALLMWRPEPRPLRQPAGSILSEMATGLRHVRHNAAMLATLVRALAFFLFASAVWSLLPLIARASEGGGSELYGTLMALIGAGAVTGAFVLPRLQTRLSSDQVAQAGTLGTAMALVLLAISATPPVLMTATFLVGLSWIAVLTAFNVSAQTALPDWVRARGLAVYLMAFFGSMALGSIMWGQVASAASVPVALLAAAAGLILALLATRSFAIGQGEGLDLGPASIWPQAPTLDRDTTGDRAAMVTVEYRISAADRAAFLAAMQAFFGERLRNGATRWHLHQDVEAPELFIESFHLPSWNEHLKQHERVSRHDAELQDLVRAFDPRSSGPLVRHFIAAE